MTKRTILLAVRLALLTLASFSELKARKPAGHHRAFAAVWVGVGQYLHAKCGYIDQTGKLVIEPQFENARDFSEGMARVRVSEKWGYINKTGQLVIKPQFAYCLDFSEGLARVRVGRKWGFIDKTGKYVIKPQFDGAGDFRRVE